RQHEQPTLLFAAVILVPVVGYSVRYLVPLGEPLDGYRDLATAFTMISAIAFVMLRMRVEQRAGGQAVERVRLLATAGEQSAECIGILRFDTGVEYANDAFCRATGYSLDEVQTLAPQRLVAPESVPAARALGDALRRGEVSRATVRIA